MRFGIIGTGNMGEAILRGCVKGGAVASENVFIFDTNEQKRAALAKELSVNACENLLDITTKCDILLIALKPNVCSKLYASQSELFGSKAVISIAAGWGMARLQGVLPKSARILRVMPNTPALVGAGMIVFENGDSLSSDEKVFAERLFASVGRVISVDAHLMDAVTAVSGSGPAYVYLFIEALADGGVRAGLPRSIALELATETVKGSAMMVAETGVHPDELKDRVCSPGGTTIEAVAALEKAGFRSAVLDAVEACREKSERMSK